MLFWVFLLFFSRFVYELVNYGLSYRRCFGSCCQANWGLPVLFLLLWYSALCTVEPLSLLYLLFILWFIYYRRWCMDKLGIFHANQTSMCLDPHLIHTWTKGSLARWNRFKSSSKMFYWPFQGGTSFVDHLSYFCLVFVIFCVCSLMPFGHLLGRSYWLSFVVLICVLLLFRYGNWLYRFLIFGLFLTCIISAVW